MREKVVAGVAVAVAGVAVAAGLVFASAGGVFGDSDTYVRPPAIDSSNVNGSNVGGVADTQTITTTSPAISVPPSPTWQIAPETTPKPTTVEPTEVTTTDETTTSREPTTRRPRTTDTTPDETTTTRPGR